MKLELKHLAPYLPYKLNYQLKGNFPIKEGVENIIEDIREINPFAFTLKKVLEWESCKPILRPLSDLREEHLKEFYQFNSIDLELIDSKEWIAELVHMIKGNDKLQLRQFNLLFEWHFDVFGLIEKGLAIDINTLNE